MDPGATIGAGPVHEHRHERELPDQVPLRPIEPLRNPHLHLALLERALRGLPAHPEERARDAGRRVDLRPRYQPERRRPGLARRVGGRQPLCQGAAAGRPDAGRPGPRRRASPPGVVRLRGGPRPPPRPRLQHVPPGRHGPRGLGGRQAGPGGPGRAELRRLQRGGPPEDLGRHRRRPRQPGGALGVGARRRGGGGHERRRLRTRGALGGAAEGRPRPRRRARRAPPHAAASGGRAGPDQGRGGVGGRGPLGRGRDLRQADAPPPRRRRGPRRGRCLAAGARGELGGEDPAGRVPAPRGVEKWRRQGGGRAAGPPGRRRGPRLRRADPAAPCLAERAGGGDPSAAGGGSRAGCDDGRPGQCAGRPPRRAGRPTRGAAEPSRGEGPPPVPLRREVGATPPGGRRGFSCRGPAPPRGASRCWGHGDRRLDSPAPGGVCRFSRRCEGAPGCRRGGGRADSRRLVRGPDA
mmetsp:Transcript_41972/g.125585  ORF Transcript_41972/g.125585 Transcript_41972/m.125585 type:complete len:466 (-) Transcript_41972:712-2109(-)